MKDQDHGWATAVVTGSQGIGSEATLKLRLDDGGVLLEKLGSEVERLMVPDDARAQQVRYCSERAGLLGSLPVPHRWKSCELRRREIDTFTQQAAHRRYGVDCALRNVKKLASVLQAAR